jgi:hypothetical protein
MAAKRKSTKSGSKRAATKKKVGRKSASKSAYGFTKRKRAHVIGSSDGHVYVVAGPGDRPRQVHVAKKGTAREISRSIGLSNRQLSGARSLLETLERAGLIRKP